MAKAPPTTNGKTPTTEKAGPKAAPAAPAAPKSTLAAIPIAYAKLRGLLGKPVDDPAVAALIAEAGKTRIDADYIIAREAGFDFALDRPEGARPKAKKVLSTLFLYRDGNDGHRGFADLPAGLAFGMSRAAALALVPTPLYTWKIGKGKVAVTTTDPHHDAIALDGHEVSIEYRDGEVSSILVTLAEDAMGGREIATHPLHFETRPPDAPDGAELVGMGLLVAWAAQRFGLPAKHASSADGEALLARAITPRDFLMRACDKTLTTLDTAPALGDFLWDYTHNVNHSHDEGARKASAAEIAKLLKLPTPSEDRRYFVDDYLGTFAGVVASPYHVPDAWAAVDRLAPVLDARHADFTATGFATPPDLALYRAAATARDAVAITVTRAAPSMSTNPDLAVTADELIALVGRPLDKAVKATLERAGLLVGKAIDAQANPTLGIAYMGSKFDIAGKRALGVSSVTFYAAKQIAYIRGLHAEVEFAGWTGALPGGLAFGATRAGAAKALGAPTSRDDDEDRWQLSKTLERVFQYEKGKLVSVRHELPREL